MTEETNKTGLQKLWDLKFPQYIGSYFAVGFGALQFLEFLNRRYDLSDSFVDKYLLIWFALLPALLILIYFKGKLNPTTAKGTLKWPKFAVIGNLLIAFLLGGLLFNGESIETEQAEIVKLTDEEGKQIEAVVPVLNKVKTIACFQFENLTGDTDLDWWSVAFSELLQMNLEQRPEYYAFSEYELSYYYDELGLEFFILPNIGMQRKIAKNSRNDYFTRIAFKREGDLFNLKGNFYRTVDGESIIDINVSNTSPYKALDAVQQLIYENIPDAMDVAAGQLNLPSSALISNNQEAYKYYTEAGVFLHKNTTAVEEALVLAKKAVVIDESCAMCHLEVGDFLYGAGKREEALAYLKNAVKYSSSLPERMQFKAKEVLYTVLGNIESNIKLQELRRKMFPYDFKSYQNLISTYLANHGVDSTKSLLKEAIANGNLESGLLELYNLELGNDQYAEAEKTLDRFSREFPEQDPEKSRYVGLYERQGNLDKAREILLERETLNPLDSDIQIDLAYLDFRSLNITKANERIENGLEQASTLTDSLSMIWAEGYFYRASGQINKAIAQMAKYEKYAASRSSRNVLLASTFINKYTLYQSIGNHGKVDDLLAELSKYSPESADQYRCSTKIQAVEQGWNSELGQSDFDGCKETFQSFGEGFGGYVDIILLYLDGAYEECVKKLEEDNGKLKNLFVNKSFLATIYANTGKMDTAKELVKSEIDRKTNSPEFYYKMAWLLEKENKTEAMEYLNIALKFWANADEDFIPMLKAKELAGRLSAYNIDAG